jgi:hypothetical protein
MLATAGTGKRSDILWLTDNKIAKQITGLWGCLKKWMHISLLGMTFFWATLFRNERREDEQPFEKCGLYKL